MKNFSGLLFMAAAVLCCVSCRDNSTVTVRQPVSVGVLSVGEAVNVGLDNYIGEVRASRTVVLSPRHNGQLTAFDLSQGDIVTKDQVVAEIESSAVIGAYEMAQATLKQAEDAYERLQKVHGTGSVSDVKMVDIETQLSKARASAESAEQALADCSVKSPFSGTVAKVFVTKGMEVSIGEPLAEIVDLSSVEIHIPVPETEIVNVKPGQRALMDVPALGLKEVQLKVVSKGVSASVLSHTYSCVLKPAGNIPGLMPGMVSRVYMSKTTGTSITIPSSSIRTDMNGRYVWTVNNDDRGCKVYVTVDGVSGEGVIVSGGLEQGDRLIVDGISKVSTGMKVNVIER